MNDEKYSKETKLSAKVWEIKKAGGAVVGPFFKVAKLSKSYGPGDRTCKLCIDEKVMIMSSSSRNPLNNRVEIFAKCRHRAKYKMEKLLNNIERKLTESHGGD